MAMSNRAAEIAAVVDPLLNPAAAAAVDSDSEPDEGAESAGAGELLPEDPDDPRIKQIARSLRNGIQHHAGNRGVWWNEAKYFFKQLVRLLNLPKEWLEKMAGLGTTQ